jgi:polyphosphate kinase
MFPVSDPMLRDRIRNEVLDAYLTDDVKARVLRPNGSYIRAWQAARKRKPPNPGFNAQEFLLALAEGKQNINAIPVAPERQRRPRLIRKAIKAS